MSKEKTVNTLADIEAIKQHFQQDEDAYYFISASNFNLMPMADWVQRWYNVNFLDCYDGRNSSVLLPAYDEEPIFKDIESINHFLLDNEKIVAHIENTVSSGHKANALFLFYDHQLEEQVDKLGMSLIMPPNKLVRHIDNKITTTEIGNSVDVPSVPNALTKIGSYSELRRVMQENDLGEEVVIQTAYGDSGKTTFFISSESDYHQYADKIEAEDRVKVMKKIPCLQVAMEACATRQGTYIGPILTEVIGHPKLTPYRGGWCGNDVNPYIFDSTAQQTMYEYTERLGSALYEQGYRGYFEVDYLVDVADPDNVQVYLGEINPRVTGISAITNMSSFCLHNIPLFLFHLLEYSEVDFSLSPTDFNRSVREYEHPAFGQLVFKYTQARLNIITAVPQSGVYRFSQGELSYARYADNPGHLQDDEVYILRIARQDSYIYKGADILILFAPYRLQDEHNQLTPVADNLITAVHNQLAYRELTEEENIASQRYAKHASLKASSESI